MPAVDPILTIAPPPLSRMTGAAARIPKKGPVRLTASTRSQSARDVLARSTPRNDTPALLTSTCSDPNVVFANATASCQSCSLATSGRQSSAAPPAWRMDCESAPPSASSTSATTTRAPAAANMRASAAPCPRLPPVMRTVLLLNFCCTALALSCWTRWGQANRESAGSEAITPRGSVHGPICRRQKPARFNSFLHSVPSKLFVTQLPVLQKLHHRQHRDDRAKTHMPGLERASVAKDEWRCRQPQSAGQFQPLFRSPQDHNLHSGQ